MVAIPFLFILPIYTIFYFQIWNLASRVVLDQGVANTLSLLRLPMDQFDGENMEDALAFVEEIMKGHSETHLLNSEFACHFVGREDTVDEILKEINMELIFHDLSVVSFLPWKLLKSFSPRRLWRVLRNLERAQDAMFESLKTIWERNDKLSGRFLRLVCDIEIREEGGPCWFWRSRYKIVRELPAGVCFMIEHFDYVPNIGDRPVRIVSLGDDGNYIYEDTPQFWYMLKDQDIYSMIEAGTNTVVRACWPAPDTWELVIDD